METYIARFKNARNSCKAQLPENEYIRLVVDNFKSTLIKKFVEQQFTDLCPLVDMVGRYEKLIKEENKRKTTNRETYCKSQNLPMNFIEVQDESQDDELENDEYGCKVAKIIS